MVSTDLLVKHGFIKSSSKDKYLFDEKTKKFKAKEDYTLTGSDADVEKAEETNLSAGNGYIETGYPKPKKRYKIVRESFGQNVEEVYFWFLNHIMQDQGFSKVDKITDIFSASENSAFFGASQQRLGIQQDRAAQFLRGIGEMIKQLFSLVRELRIIDERLVLYNNYKSSRSADNTLKGLYIDLAEGGTKNPGSVLGLAQQVNYTILPDLFFGSKSKSIEDIDKEIDSLEFNEQVKSILKRKLYSYLNWVDKTHKEHTARRKFLLQYLRQHWTVIKMYMSWIKPYLRNTVKLSMNSGQLDSPYLINAFETSMTEIEILAYKKAKNNFHPCIIATFEYRTKPAMVQGPEFQRGPSHVGRVTITLRAYSWSEKQIEAYKRMKNEEDLELLGVADANVKSAMEALGDELEKYLEEAGEPVEEKVENKKSSKKRFDWEHSAIGPFIEMGKGFTDIFQAFTGFDLTYKGDKKDSGNPDESSEIAMKSAFITYKLFKKTHGMLAF